MKPILIDNIKEELASNSQEFTVDVNGTTMTGWQIAKPLNYDPEYLPKKERKEMADAVLKGKAIAVCFFEDLSEEEQSEHVKGQIEKAEKYKNRTLSPTPKLPLS
jgi:hypothetical protein